MRVIEMREALREAMIEEMLLDDKVFLMGEEVAEYNGAYKISKGMLDMFSVDKPNFANAKGIIGDYLSDDKKTIQLKSRIIDTPIAELGFTGIGVGAAINGLRPIIEFMTFNFSLVAIDQIINTAAKIHQMSGGQFSCPIVFRGASGSAGTLAAQHSQVFESWYANCPGLKVISPSNPADAKGLLKSAIRDNDPVIFMESEQMYGDKGEVPEGEYTIPIGVADIKRKGTHVTLVSYNKMVKITLAAAEELAKEGIDAEVIDLRTIRPLDTKTILDSVKKTNRLVVIDESWPFGSISSEVAFRVQKDAFDYLDAPVLRVNGADTPMAYSLPLVEMYLPSVAKIVKAAKEVMYIKK